MCINELNGHAPLRLKYNSFTKLSSITYNFVQKSIYSFQFFLLFFLAKFLQQKQKKCNMDVACLRQN